MTTSSKQEKTAVKTINSGIFQRRSCAGWSMRELEFIKREMRSNVLPFLLESFVHRAKKIIRSHGIKLADSLCYSATM